MELLSKGNIQVSYTILVISHPNQRVCVRQHKRKKGCSQSTIEYSHTERYIK